MELFDVLFRAKARAARTLSDEGSQGISLYVERASIYQVGEDFEIRPVGVRLKNKKGEHVFRPVCPLSGEYLRIAGPADVTDLILKWARAASERAGRHDKTP